MSKKNVLITGASRGIGKAILESFGKEYYFIATATNDQSLKDIENNLQKLNLEGHASKLNLEDRNSIKEFVSSLEDQDISPHILINNAGITRDNIMLRMKEDEWDDVINVHLNGHYLLIKSFIKKMVKNKWGRIINISSAVAKMGNPGQTNYAASKAAIEGFTRSLALEIASRGITVNAIAPGFIKTEILDSIGSSKLEEMAKNIPIGRIGVPEDISKLVSFLASDESSYITGQVLHVNGGLTL